MARDKQLIVRIEETERDKFKQFCQDNGLEVSSFLYGLIRRFNDGSLSLEEIKQSTDSAIDSGAIAEIKKSILAEVNQAIAGLEQKIAELEGKATDGPAFAPVVEKTQRVSLLSQAEENLLHNDCPVTPTTANEIGEGLSSAELAEKLQISLATVKSWAQRWKKTPPEFKPKGSETAIAIPPYIYQNKKWYPGPEN